MKAFVDLFAGLGGASSDFCESPNWVNLQIDNNPILLDHNDHLYMLDLSNSASAIDFISVWLQGIENIDPIDHLVIWASPPCLEFSMGYNSPRAEAGRAGIEFYPDMALLRSSKIIIDHFQKHCDKNGIKFSWVIENVRGASLYFYEFLGMRFKQKIGSFFLWGNFPEIHITEFLQNHTKPDKRHSPIRANIRAKIPQELSHQVRIALEGQRNLFEF